MALVDIVVLGLVTYGIHSVISKDSLTKTPRARALATVQRMEADVSYRRWLVWIVSKIEEGTFCSWCGSYWVGMAVVCHQLDVAPWRLGWNGLLLTFAVRSVALIVHKFIGPHKSDGETRVRLL